MAGDETDNARHHDASTRFTPKDSDYETDLYAWTQAQAAAIRAKNWAAVDLEHVADEIESLGRSDRRTITHQLERLLRHLLKWRYQPTHRTSSWRRTIGQARDAITDLVDESPSLQPLPGQVLAPAYARARRRATEDTGMPLAAFPDACSWPVAQVLNAVFLPKEGQA